MKTTWTNRPNVCGPPGKIIYGNGASALISAKLYPISSKAKTPISGSTSNGLREVHRRCRKKKKEYKEVKNRSQEPGGSSRLENLSTWSTTSTSVHSVHLRDFAPNSRYAPLKFLSIYLPFAPLHPRPT